MATKKISSITTAFTHEPESYFVEQKYGKVIIKRLEAEKRRMDGMIYDYIVGYDQHLKILFEYRACSVNIHYYYPE